MTGGAVLELVPRELYFAVGVGNNLIMVSSWNSRESARAAIRWAREVLNLAGIKTEFDRWYDEPFSGCFVVELSCGGAGPEDVCNALLNPPCSNRGVTKS